MRVAPVSLWRNILAASLHIGILQSLLPEGLLIHCLKPTCHVAYGTVQELLVLPFELPEVLLGFHAQLLVARFRVTVVAQSLQTSL